MKEVTTKLATLLMRTSLRLNGWTDAPKPKPHQPTPQYPWWRNLAPNKIEVSDFLGAFRKVMAENKKQEITTSKEELERISLSKSL